MENALPKSTMLDRKRFFSDTCRLRKGDGMLKSLDQAESVRRKVAPQLKQERKSAMGQFMTVA